MLEAQKILYLSQMNNQATKEHREQNEHNGIPYISSLLIWALTISSHFYHHMRFQVASPDISDASWP